MIFNTNFIAHKDRVIDIINNFNTNGVLFGDGKRNKIKLFELGEKTINVKSFKIPHLINKIVYKYFRKSKARRSYEFANRLIEEGIGTPLPIAYFEKYNLLGLTNSYYICEHLHFDFMIRDLIETENFPDLENILKQFAQFSFNLHENGIEFLDHSPGNTLIKRKENNLYDFYLIDLNRMKFHQSMDFQLRMKNLRKITPVKEMIKIISAEYAKLYNKPEIEVFEEMWKYTSKFQKKTSNKKKLKSFRI
jgi:tRNA A-37 threonylcarbamoyl transferase component Bud32